MVKKVNKVRQQFKMYEYPMIEIIVQPNVYAYSRGEVVVALTNQVTTVKAQLKKVPFAVNDRVCNVFDKNDCLSVKVTGLWIELNGGKPKIYIKESEVNEEEDVWSMATKIVIFLVKMLSILLVVLTGWQIEQKFLRFGSNANDYGKGKRD